MKRLEFEGFDNVISLTEYESNTTNLIPPNSRLRGSRRFQRYQLNFLSPSFHFLASSADVIWVVIQACAPPTAASGLIRCVTTLITAMLTLHDLSHQVR